MNESGLASIDGPDQLAAAARRLDARYTVDGLAAIGPDDAGAVLARECPDLIEALDAVVSALRGGGMALLRRVPVRSDATLLLMCQYVGRVVAATQRPASYIEHITPSAAVETARRPHSQRRTALMPHTDQSARERPPDYLALACVANDAEAGGESVLVPVEPIVHDLARSDPRSYELLQDPEFPIFNVPRRDFAVTAPLLSVHRRAGAGGGPVRHHEVRFRDEAVRAGMAEMNRPSDDHVAAFEKLSASIHDEQRWVVHRPRPGHVLFFDNRRVLHGRREILGGHHRHLKRLNGRYWPAGRGAAQREGTA